MVFFEALLFPLRKEIAFIVLKCVLAYTVINIILALINDAVGGNQAIGYIFQYHPLVYVFMLSGYSLDVMRHHHSGEGSFPTIELREHLKRGLQIFLASLVYLIPAWLLYLIMNNLMQTWSSPYGYYYRDAQQASCLLAVLWIVQALLGFYLFGLIQVGVIRFAFSGDTKTLYQYSVNLAYINDRLSRSFGFFVRAIGLIVVYGILFFGIDWLYIQGSIQFLFDLQIAFLFFIASLLRYAILAFLVLSYLFSIAHLQAGFGYELDIIFTKAKSEAQTA